MKNENSIDFSWIYKVILRRKWMIISLVGVSVIFAIIALILFPPGYKATTTMMIQSTESSNTSELNVLMAGERLALTYSQIMNSRPVLSDVISKLKLDLSVSDLADMITITPVQQTQLVRLSVFDPNADQAVALANAISESFISYVRNLTTVDFNQALDNTQKSIDQKQTDINAIISNLDAQNKQKAELQAELTKLELLLSQKQNEYQTLVTNVQSLDLTVTQLSNKIHVVEPAYIENPNALPPYSAAVTFFFEKDIISSTADATLRLSDLIGQIYGPMLTREALLNEVLTRLNLAESPETFASRISYEAVVGTQFLKVHVRNQDAAQATQMADALAAVFIEQNQTILAEPYKNRLADLKGQMDTLTGEMVQIQGDINTNTSNAFPVDLEIARLNSDLNARYSDLRTLQTNYDQLTLDAGRAANSVVISEPATHAARQFQKYIFFTGIAVFLALAAGVGLAFFMEHLDDKIRTQGDVTSLLDAKPIAMIGHIARGEDKLVFGSRSSPLVSEDFRKLSAAIRRVLKAYSIRTLLVTSPHSAEGKSIIAANLGLALAKTGTRVIIIDADLHLPRQHVIFDVDAQGGLSDALAGKRTDIQLKATRTANLQLATSGLTDEDPVELLSSPYLEKILSMLSDKVDLIIIDSPPILTLADASFLTTLVDGALLVLRSDATTRKSAVDATTILKNAGIRFVGNVLNDVNEPVEGGYYQYYGARQGTPSENPKTDTPPENPTQQE